MPTTIKDIIVGKARDPMDPRIFHHVSLAAFLAWVGLGADGLSSSAYGPEEAFKALGDHAYLAVWLAVLTAFTVCIISLAYSKVIELFPAGGGGYLVATKLLGPKLGVVSGLRSRRRLRPDDLDLHRLRSGPALQSSPAAHGRLEIPDRVHRRTDPHRPQSAGHQGEHPGSGSDLSALHRDARPAHLHDVDHAAQPARRHRRHGRAGRERHLEPARDGSPSL